MKYGIDIATLGRVRGARRRAARWDGWIVSGMDEQAAMVRPPTQLAAEITEVRRDSDRSYDVAVVGVSHGPSDPVFDRYAQAGVAWWLEHIGGWRASYPELLARLTAGPPVAR